jgi:hypothetical protein
MESVADTIVYIQQHGVGGRPFDSATARFALHLWSSRGLRNLYYHLDSSPNSITVRQKELRLVHFVADLQSA